MVKKTKKKPAPKTKSARPAPGKGKAPSKKKKKKAPAAPKSGAKKKAPAKAVRQPTKKKTVVKKVSQPSPAAKAHKPAKKTSAAKPEKPAKQAPATKDSARKADAKSARVTPEEAASRLAQDQLRQQIVAKARSGAKAQKAVAFTLDDVRGELARASKTGREARSSKSAETGSTKQAAAPSKIVDAKIEQKRYGAASLADILGYNPTKDERPVLEESQIDKKFLRYYRLLVELRDHVNAGLQTHTEETLKRSSREDTGDLSGYGQHMADAGTDTFDRDFALSLVSNEQEALYEIEEAIKRIRNGTYGNCELTGKPITKERLLAVPFARYSVESQAEIEKVQRRSSQRGGVFGDAAGEEGAKLLEDDSD